MGSKRENFKRKLGETILEFDIIDHAEGTSDRITQEIEGYDRKILMLQERLAQLYIELGEAQAAEPANKKAVQFALQQIAQEIPKKEITDALESEAWGFDTATSNLIHKDADTIFKERV